MLGTFVEILSAPAPQAEAGIEAAFEAIKRVHDLMSFHDAESDVSRLNRASPRETVAVHDWTYKVLQTSLELHRVSEGCFNIAVAPALQRLGLLPTSMHCPSRALATEFTHSFALLPGNGVQVQGLGSKIDLGGIAKGFAVDRAVDVLREQGVQSGLVNAGGDLAAFGPEEYIVAVRDPRDPSRLMGRVAIENAALATSGIMFDPVEPSAVRRSSVIDPKTGQPVRAICGATVRASSCLIADALTKVVMIAGIDSSEILDRYQASALLVMANGEVEVTADWQDGFSIAA
jgi:thiamine biosynthesis lipoprotein